MKLSKALKSILVGDVYDPGHIVLMKRLSESSAMVILSTTEAEFYFVSTNSASQMVHYRSHCSQIH